MKLCCIIHFNRWRLHLNKNILSIVKRPATMGVKSGSKVYIHCLNTLNFIAALCSGVARLWSQAGHRGLGKPQHRKSPSSSMVQGQSPCGGLRVKPPEATYIQTICSCQMLFYAGMLPSPSSISPLPTKKKTGSARIPWPNTAGAGWGRAVPMAVLLALCINECIYSSL